MCNNSGKIIFFLLGTLWQFCALAQNNVNSPYSRYGLGDLLSDDFASVRAMGGISAAFTDPYFTNLVNPASLAGLQATSFELGFDAYHSNLTAVATDQKAGYWGGNLNYFSLAFPVINPVNRLLDRRSQDFNWGMAISLLPYSRVSHFSSIESSLEDIGRIREENEGSGGLNKITWSHGVKYKHWYGGIALGYLFGDIKTEQAVIYRDLPLAFDNYYRNDASYRGFLLKGGLQYEIDLSKGKGAENSRDIKLLTVGISTNAKTRFRTLSNDFRALKGITYQGLSDEFPDEETDTVFYQEDIENFGKLAGDLSAGIVYHRGTRWLVGVNLNWLNGKGYENDLSDYTYNSAFQVGLGMQYVPDATSYNSYFRRVMYRGGFRFGTDPRSINGSQIKQFSLNAGIGLPVVVSRQLSFINLGLNYHRLGGNIPIKEGLFGFNVGVTLNNNLWFLKRKFD
jgi:hypothetical protein